MAGVKRSAEHGDPAGRRRDSVSPGRRGSQTVIHPRNRLPGTGGNRDPDAPALDRKLFRVARDMFQEAEGRLATGSGGHLEGSAAFGIGSSGTLTGIAGKRSRKDLGRSHAASATGRARTFKPVSATGMVPGNPASARYDRPACDIPSRSIGLDVPAPLRDDPLPADRPLPNLPESSVVVWRTAHHVIADPRWIP
jgi:hypothetical protein